MHTGRKVKVLWVDDSLIVRALVRRIFEKYDDLELIGIARNGKEALTLIMQERPDILCTDLMMPEMDGLELIKKVMNSNPCPILVVSDYVSNPRGPVVFKALELGALDILPKASLESWSSQSDEIHKLHDLLMNLVNARPFVMSRQKKHYSAAHHSDVKSSAPINTAITTYPEIIVLGISTGGPLALKQLFSHLTSDLKIPLLIVQHIGKGFLQGLVGMLQKETKIKVNIARDGEKLKMGKILFAPEDYHLVLKDRYTLALTKEKPYKGHRPSVNVTMRAVVRYYNGSAAGILMTGMGDDGAEGLLEIARAGGETIAQDETSSVIFGMPKEAVRKKAARYILDIEGIANKINQWNLNFMKRRNE